MTHPPRPDQRKKYAFMAIIAAVLAVFYMIFLIRTDTSLPIVSRRVGGSPAITYSRNPTSFLFGFFPLWGGMFIFVMLVNFAAEALGVYKVDANESPYAQRGSLSSAASRVIALILSLMIPGLGHAFGMHYLRAAAYFVVFMTLSVALQYLYKQNSSVGMALPVVIVLALRVAAAFDASRLELNRPNIRWPGRMYGVAGFAFVYLVASLALKTFQSS